MKKRLGFIHEGVLGHLLQIYFGFVKPQGSYYLFTFNYYDKQVIRSLHQISDFIDSGTTISGDTVKRATTILNDLQSLEDSCLMSSEERNRVKECREELTYINELLKKQEQSITSLDTDTLEYIDEIFPEISNTL